jgi:hypothetical protein
MSLIFALVTKSEQKFCVFLCAMRCDSNAGANCIGVTLLVLKWDIFNFNFESVNATHTHTHTHIYIYTYIVRAERRICEGETWWCK